MAAASPWGASSASQQPWATPACSGHMFAHLGPAGAAGRGGYGTQGPARPGSLALLPVGFFLGETQASRSRSLRGSSTPLPGLTSDRPHGRHGPRRNHLRVSPCVVPPRAGCSAGKAGLGQCQLQGSQPIMGLQGDATAGLLGPPRWPGWQSGPGVAEHPRGAQALRREKPSPLCYQ